MERFGESIKPIVGSKNALSLSGDQSTVEEELDNLREQVEKLQDEVGAGCSQSKLPTTNEETHSGLSYVTSSMSALPRLLLSEPYKLCL